MSDLNLPVDPALIDVSFPDLVARGVMDEGALHGIAGGFSEEELFASGAVAFPDNLRIRKGSEWDDWIAENEKHKSSADDYSARFTHQGNSHECVCHASIQSFEIAYNRQLGVNRAVYFSPLALYTRITGGRQWGGSVVNDALRELMNRGAIPEFDGPEWLGGKGGQSKFFKACVQQTSGRSEDHWPAKGFVTPSRLPEGWQDTARHFRVLEAYYIPDREAHFSALLRGWCVVNGRSGHSIPHVKVVKSNGRYLSRYKDSYNVYRYDSEGMTGGGFAIRSVTMPDDPAKPAGADMRAAA